MAASKYNGVILPALPQTTYSHLLILYTTNDSGEQVYALWASAQPFRADIEDRRVFCRPIDSNAEVYIANTTYWNWYRGSFSEEGGDDAESILVVGEFVWANHNVYMNNSLPPTMPTWDQVAFPYLLLEEVNTTVTSGNAFPKWWAWYSSEPFVMENLTAPEVGEVAGPLGYGGFSYTTDVVGCQGYYIWGSEAVTGWRAMSNAEITSRLTFDPEEPRNNLNVWSNHDIVGTNGYEIKANSWFELLCYKASEPVEVPVPLPTDVAITGGNATYDQYTTAGEMFCTATCPEGGRLSYKWYRYADSEENAVVCGYTGDLKPSTMTAGVWYYFCEVTNNQYGGTATVRSVSVPITINAVELPDTPEGTKASKCKHIIGYVLRLCGVPMAELIAEMICKVKKVVASHYLYGTPSETGKIGLRSGDTVTYYDGIVYKSLPTTTTHPVCILAMGGFFGTTPTLYTGKSMIYRTFDGDYQYGLEDLQPVWWLYDDGWKQSTTQPGNEFISTVDSTYALWTNADICYENGTIAHAATEPIPVGELVDTINNIPIYEDLR